MRMFWLALLVVCLLGIANPMGCVHLAIKAGILVPKEVPDNGDKRSGITVKQTAK